MAKNFISNVSMQYQYFDIQLGHPNWNSKKVLDFGGNIGNILTDPNCMINEENYYCLDVSKKAIDSGQQKYPSACFKFYDCYNLSFNPIGVVDLPIPDLGVKFDYILAYSIFTHILEEEMVDKVNQLLSFLSESGILIFTFLDAKYNGSVHYPGFENIQNIEKRLRRLNNGSINEDLVQKSRGVQSMALVNGTILYTGNENVVELARKEGDTLFTYFTPEYLKSIFDCEIVNPPSENYSKTYPGELQHSCIIKNATRK
jgi:hypothetical protein